MKRYGLILADNGSDWYFQGTLDSGWSNSLMDQLKQIPASAFVAVDESGCRVGPNTGQFAYGACAAGSRSARDRAPGSSRRSWDPPA